MNEYHNSEYIFLKVEINKDLKGFLKRNYVLFLLKIYRHKMNRGMVMPEHYETKKGSGRGTLF
jgi:hypothetical protein